MPNIYGHGVTINGKHTWRDFGLLPPPGEAPVIAPPPPKLDLWDFPLVDGAVDLSAVPLNRLFYGIREGRLVFNHARRSETFEGCYSAILGAVHGQTCTLTLDDDPAHAYTGRVWIDEVRSSYITGQIALAYALQPYRTQSAALSTAWHFDDAMADGDPPIFTASFSTACTAPRTIINPNSGDIILGSASGSDIVCTVSASCTIYAGGTAYAATASSVPGITLHPGKNIVTFAPASSGTVNISIAYQLRDCL